MGYTTKLNDKQAAAAVKVVSVLINFDHLCKILFTNSLIKTRMVSSIRASSVQ